MLTSPTRTPCPLLDTVPISVQCLLMDKALPDHPSLCAFQALGEEGSMDPLGWTPPPKKRAQLTVHPKTNPLEFPSRRVSKGQVWTHHWTPASLSGLSFPPYTPFLSSATPPANWRRNPNKSAEQIGGPIFQQNRFPVPWISVPGPKHTFLLVAL